MAEQFDLMEIADRLGPTFAERIEGLDDTDAFVTDNYTELKDAGVFSALVPHDLGGHGVSHSEMCAFIRHLAHYCSSTALAVSMHQHLVAAAVFNHRAGRPGKALLEKVGATEAVLISTGANDWLESNGSARKVDGGYLVSAIKPFTSGSPAGAAFVTSVAHEDGEDGPEVLHFAIPANSEGISFLDDWRTMGMRATGSQTVRFEDVFVPEEAVAMKRPLGRFHPAFNVIITVADPIVMSAYVGAAEAACEAARQPATKRKDDPVVPYLLGEMENRLTTAQLACDDMVRLANDLDFTPSEELSSKVLIRKTVTANSTIGAVEKAMEVSGGGGYFRKAGIERLLRDVHASQFHPLPEKRQQLFTGRLSIGLEPVPAAA